MISCVSHAVSQGNSSGTTSSGVNTTGANLLVAVVTSYRLSAEPTFSDSRGNTWTPLTSRDDGLNCRVRMYYCLNPSVGAGHTFSSSGVNSYSAIAVSAWSGVTTSSAFDTENSNTAITATSVAAGSVTPSQGGELIIVGGCWDNPGAPDSPSINNGFSVIGSAGNLSSTSFGVLHGYLVQSVAAAVNPTITWSTVSQCAVAITAFRPAVGGSVDRNSPIIRNIIGSAA